ncbi:STM4015 family protein [bacterium]|nr:STM4015 family protein [bacterium]
MTISKHVDTFAGRPVRDYEPGKPGPAGCAYRLALDYDDERAFPELLDLFLTEHGGPGLGLLVVGAWTYNEMLNSAAQPVEALVAARDRMPNLAALFFGDITYDQCEMSWIQHGDVSPLLPAFPKLEVFRLRGTTGLTFGSIRHPNLKSFALESGGLAEAVLNEVWAADLPQLEHLELWLGESNYGGIDATLTLDPLLSGDLFPRLRHLGLRNCAIADDVAKAVAASPLLARLDVLDLSLGNLGDEGAKALLASPGIKTLKKLDLHHHFMSDSVAAEFAALGVPADVGDQKEPYTYGDEMDRYITVGE